MKLPNWVRFLPHSNYGNWCGRGNTHEKESDAKPIDEGDSACMIHDFALRAAQKEKDKKKRNELMHKADADLWRGWKMFKPKTFYGKLYRKAILFIFKNKYCKINKKNGA